MSAKMVQEIEQCSICGCEGTVLYSDLKDLSGDNAGIFASRICPSCKLIWLSPRPLPEDMPGFYRDYFTHVRIIEESPVEPADRFLGGLRDCLRESIMCGYYGYPDDRVAPVLRAFGGYLGRIAFLRERAANETQALPFYVKDGRVLDVGCGNGSLLLSLKKLGWEVRGVETDPCAADEARRRGIVVESAPLERAGLPDSWADAVILNHVLEHLYEPAATLRECLRVLKTGGRLIVFTPNSLSLGHKKFGRHWVALDPPRHLSIFSPFNLDTLLCSTGFPGADIRTTARGASGGYNASSVISSEGRMRWGRVARQDGSRLFALKEFCLCGAGLPKGEEIEAVAVKR